MTKHLPALKASVLIVVERIWSEAGHYYLLGYSPALSKRELHRIQVSVGRQGVRARARRSRG